MGSSPRTSTTMASATAFLRRLLSRCGPRPTCQETSGELCRPTPSGPTLTGPTGPAASGGRAQRLLARIYERVEVQPGPDGCHLWLGSDSGTGRGGGYGRLRVDGETMAVHIVAWVCRHGPKPRKKQIDHTCSQRRCVRDSHHELVTHKKNQERRASRARDHSRASGHRQDHDPAGDGGGGARSWDSSREHRLRELHSQGSH